MKIGLTKHQPDFFVTTLYDLLSLVRSVTLYEIAEFYLVMSREFCNFAAMIAKRLTGIIVVGAMMLLTGCSGDGYTPELLAIDSILNEKPDSALRLLDSLGTEAKSWSKSQRMRHSLLTMKAQNKAYVPFTSDSLANDLVSYYDRHGSPNDRLLSRYLLGCVYRDLHEAPHAVDCYLDAISQADTPATECDFYTLECAYSQLADTYHNQLLLTNEIEARKKASYYAFRANQTQWGIYNQAMLSNTYILMNKKDSAEIILRSVLEQYRKHGYIQQALRISRTLMHLYIDNPLHLAEAKALMDQFEAESELFDEHHELPPSQRQYYSYKGKYYESLNVLDSAEYYYRKIYRPNMTYVQKDPMYRGLLSVFKKRHQADSVAKYALLYGEANDSSIAKKDQELTAQMASLYNYNRNQKIAEQEKQKSRKARSLLVLVIVIFIGCAILIIRKRKERKDELRMLNQSLLKMKIEREGITKELEKIKANDYESLIVQKERKEEELNSVIVSLQRQIGQADFEDHIHQLTGSDIVKAFNEKKLYKQGVASPTKKEWKLLEQQFRKDMPATSAMLGKAGLSPMELRICILFIIGFDDKDVNTIFYSTPQTISKAKRHANNKLFCTDSAQSLKSNLIINLGL